VLLAPLNLTSQKKNRKKEPTKRTGKKEPQKEPADLGFVYPRFFFAVLFCGSFRGFFFPVLFLIILRGVGDRVGLHV
jgi:hypothetical protein